MANDFNINEILEMAEQIERNGAKFYRGAAKNVKDKSHNGLLLELAEMEDQHEKTFAALRAELTEDERKSTVYDPEDEMPLYLQALADTRVFYEKTVDTTSIKEILKEAITAEKDSIVFYLGMKELVPKRLGQGKMDIIIKEEMSHIRLLAGKLTAL
ncbi:MAG: ferritin family protein [Proteobacteria bacterium]|nr:ferritin family protein [Pseudomonadota bacterium]